VLLRVCWLQWRGNAAGRLSIAATGGGKESFLSFSLPIFFFFHAGGGDFKPVLFPSVLFRGCAPNAALSRRVRECACMSLHEHCREVAAVVRV